VVSYVVVEMELQIDDHYTLEKHFLVVVAVDAFAVAVVVVVVVVVVVTMRVNAKSTPLKEMS